MILSPSLASFWNEENVTYQPLQPVLQTDSYVALQRSRYHVGLCASCGSGTYLMFSALVSHCTLLDSQASSGLLCDSGSLTILNYRSGTSV